MLATADNDPLLAMVHDVTDAYAGLGQQMEWAEEELDRAVRRHPGHRDVLFHSFSLLTPTHPRMATACIFRSHCRELLDRVVHDADTRPGTAAEVFAVCHDTSLTVPLRSPAMGLYLRMWSAAFPDKRIFTDTGQHHEALEGATIDGFEATARRRLTVAHRRLDVITCAGRHHGEPVPCAYATKRRQQPT